MMREPESSSHRKKHIDQYLTVNIRRLSPRIRQYERQLIESISPPKQQQQPPILNSQQSIGHKKYKHKKSLQPNFNANNNNPHKQISSHQGKGATNTLNNQLRSRLHLTEYRSLFQSLQPRKDYHRNSLQAAIMSEITAQRKVMGGLFKRNPNLKEMKKYRAAHFLNIESLKPRERKDSSFNAFGRRSTILEEAVTVRTGGPIQLNRIVGEKVQYASIDGFSLQSTHFPKIQFSSSYEPTTSFSSVLPIQTQDTISFSPTKSENPKKTIVRQKPFVAPYQRYHYRDFIWKVSMSHYLQPEVPSQAYSKPLKVFIGPGNNKMLVKSLLKRRSWWKIVEKYEDCQFAWTQIKMPQAFRSQSSCQSLVPRDHIIDFESVPYRLNVERQTKSTQLQNPDINLRFLPSKDVDAWKTYFNKHRQGESKLNQQMTYRNKHFKREGVAKFNPQNLKIHNHLQNNYVIGNKKALFYTMSKYYELTNQDIAEYLPLTYHIESGLEDPIYFKFINTFYENAKKQRRLEKEEGPQAKNKIRNIWIVKPGQFTNRGTGITVCMTLQEIKSLVKTKEKHPNGNPKTYIVQSYIDKPLLYNRRKFDIRHYMMISSLHGIIRGYFYEEGYLRTTSFQYTVKNSSTGVHLTNDAIQKYLPEYGKYEKGNKLSYAEFQKYLDREYNKRYCFYTMVYPIMKKIAADSIRASFLSIDRNKKEHNFEIFGMDFMIDQFFHPWLIEINTNPCLELSCPLLGKIIPAMVENAFRLGLDPLVPPPANINLKGSNFSENALQTNRFELIFDQLSQGQQLRRIYEGSSYKPDKQFANLEEEDEVYQDQGKELDDS